jgi:hypothetical protein
MCLVCMDVVDTIKSLIPKALVVKGLKEWGGVG